ncbi:LGFP repeat-containing protein [Kineococcus radiotolerans]|uniref:LGFP repeat protein n=1 Tax=Kineococcus radiotolerans (strain ATCC BAA-149 / DSM 14245 / SRS30216) TaxID=266940 RepID=A6WCF3_KINRD|nr:LGFP repeat-containing protein [Kineococcus radiotolerans]ABS04492.1 LGFP repeat protein [Kineococcus radiotolerans SRS30216 = ATCC BAA-149]
MRHDISTTTRRRGVLRLAAAVGCASALVGAAAVPASARAEPTIVIVPGVPQAATPQPDGSVLYNRGGVKRTVKGAILGRYQELEAQEGRLGWPVTDEVALRGGAVSVFEHGNVYWTSASGAHVVEGPILGAYADGGWEHGWLGFPTSDADAVAGGVVQHFTGGLVYLQDGRTTARAVRGAILGRYAAAGWETGDLGFPTTSETALAGGAFTHFEHGSVYWSSATGAQVVSGSLRDGWARLGWEKGWLGYPSSEAIDLDRGGAVQRFQGGLVYRAPATDSSAGAVVALHGAVLNRFAADGWERGALGYPLIAEEQWDRGTVTSFENGVVASSAAGTYAVLSPEVLGAWKDRGWETGLLGWPTAEQQVRANGVRQTFTGGTVTYDDTTSTTIVDLLHR